jgi:hypothetical protein
MQRILGVTRKQRDFPEVDHGILEKEELRETPFKHSGPFEV